MSFGEILRASPPVRCKPDGSLYELTPAQKKRCDELIRKECFCYSGGNCLYLEDKEGPNPCAQITSIHIFCRWFQNAILPLDWKLEGEIFRDEHLRICDSCGRGFRSSVANVKYCPDCRQEMKRKKTRERVRRCREKNG